MKILIVFMAVLVPMAMLLAVLWVLLRRSADRWQEDEEAGMWHLELLNLRTGEKLSKDFSGRLELGRTAQHEEPENMLFLGMFSTISRQQCRLIGTEDAVWIENTSKTNRSVVNNFPLKAPQTIFQEDVLQLGGVPYLVLVLQPW